MPEIPDLEAIRGFLNTRIAGREIISAVVRIPVVVRTPAQEMRETLAAERFGLVDRHGKVLLFNLASGRVLAINPMLTGRFQYVESTRKVAGRTCIVLGVEGGRDLRYLDERVMGKIYLVEAGALPSLPGWPDNGPDLLDPDLTAQRWLERLKPYRGGIKNIIVNAKFVQGIGNAYADEILWEAMINPYTPKTKLAEHDQRRLYHAARDVMAWATPLVAERMIQGDTLDYEERRDFLRVHRRGGEPCPRCGARITEITAGQRITDFCRTCQPGGPRLSKER